MSRLLVALLAVTTACASTTTQSSAGMFVGDIVIYKDEMYVSRCDLGLTVGENPGANAAIGVLSVLAVLGGGGGGGGGGSGKKARTTATNCVTQNRGAL